MLDVLFLSFLLSLVCYGGDGDVLLFPLYEVVLSGGSVEKEML